MSSKSIATAALAIAVTHSIVALANECGRGSGANEAADRVPYSCAAYFVAATGKDAGSGAFDSPFATLGRAQVAMRETRIKRTYVRAGFYSHVRLTLTNADDGESWSYFPKDGVNTAILDGGATGPDSGNDVFTLLGGSNITIEGLTIQHFRNWGVGIHGGRANPPEGFSTAAMTANADQVLNNVIQYGYTTANAGWAGGGVWAQGKVTHLDVANNVISYQFGSGIRIGSNGDGMGPDDDVSNLVVRDNVVLNTNISTGDNGAIYVQDQNFVSTNMRIVGNFIRDYQSEPAMRNGNVPARDVAIYVDRGASNLLIEGNVIANSSNALQGSRSLDSTQALFVGSGGNVIIQNNVIDLGVDAKICALVYEHYYATDPPMHGNRFSNNIIVGSWSGTSGCYALGVGPHGYPSGTAGGAMEPPGMQDNIYQNYGIGTVRTSGNAFGDNSPIVNREGPLLSGPEYKIFRKQMLPNSMSGSFADHTRGPPGYVIPANGSAPSYAPVD